MRLPQRVRLQGAVNVRDVGGLRTTDGSVVRSGLVFRGDALSSLTEADVAALGALGMATVIDFRGEDEVRANGEDRLPSHCRLVPSPLLDEATQLLADVLLEAFTSGDLAVVEQLLGGGRAQEMSQIGLSRQVEQPATIGKYAAALRVVAESNEPLLYHCTSGKDRTGLMTALLLGTLGVPDESIVSDYLFSNVCNAGRHAALLETMAKAGVQPSLVEPLLVQRRDPIERVLDRVHEDCGGWDAFTRDVLGLDDDTVDALRGRLLTSS